MHGICSMTSHSTAFFSSTLMIAGTSTAHIMVPAAAKEWHYSSLGGNHTPGRHLRPGVARHPLSRTASLGVVEQRLVRGDPDRFRRSDDDPLLREKRYDIRVPVTAFRKSDARAVR